MESIDAATNIPDGTYTVTIQNANLDTWANGTLVVLTASGVTTMTYNSLATDQNNLSVNNVSWRVALNDNSGNSCSVKFRGGDHANNAITGGKATSPCFRRPAGDVEDSWSATSPAVEDSAAAVAKPY